MVMVMMVITDDLWCQCLVPVILYVCLSHCLLSLEVSLHM